jgi:hypothetical protein
VAYGLLAGDPDPNQVIVGGCVVDGSEHEAECRDCGKPYEQPKRRFVPLAEFAMPTAEKSHMRLANPIDVSKIDEENLLDLCDTILEARLELVVRGWDPFALEAYCESMGMRFVPLANREAFYGVYEPESESVLAAFQFHAHAEKAFCLFALPDMDEWEAADDEDGFFELMDTFDLAKVQVWQIRTADDFNEENDIPGAERWGSAMIAAAFEGETLTHEELAQEAVLVSPAALWPTWFSPEHVFLND